MSKTKKKQVLKLYMTKEDRKRNDKRKGMDESDEEIDDENEQDKPKKIVQKLVDDNTKVATPGDKIISKTFTYEEADVFVILDQDKKPWYKGKDIATVLEYKNTKDALCKHVDKKYKMSFADMGSQIATPIKIDPQTTFINNSGIFQLVSRSKKPEAVKLWEFITEEVLPELFTTGTYTMPITETDIDKLNKSFYDDNMLSKYMGNPCVYFAYVGKHQVKINGIIKEEHIIKFGETRKMEERDLKQHRKFYKKFNVLGIWKTLANVEVEKQLETNFKSLNMIVDLKIKGMNKTKEENRKEHIILTEKHNLQYCLDMIEKVVKETSLPQENEYKNIIKDLEHKNEILTEKYKHLNELNNQLKENLNDLRTKIHHKK
ncbi:putative Bro-N domain-containing protein [Tupanvirus deep ocean]|uniref:Bro-N domain-containing protein n=2 Tax=Tupanvirus TaxID=2094720 RepID=A0AC62A998_9VIRU|nr:putative Bro-N domain-containing protein [Tupanvirus deep ocean]QKU34334.1 putative Bro-N domain-containing protein [Tupanvirus deep ocean]